MLHTCLRRNHAVSSDLSSVCSWRILHHMFLVFTTSPWSMLINTEGIPVLIAVVLLVSSFILLLAVSLSVPIVRTSKILTLRAVVDGDIRSVDFGIWGYCLRFVHRYVYSAGAWRDFLIWVLYQWQWGNRSQSSVYSTVGWLDHPIRCPWILQATENLLNVPSNIETSMLTIYPAGQSSTTVSCPTSWHNRVVAALAFISFIWFLSVALRNRTGARRSFQAIRDPPFSRLQFILTCLTTLATFFVLLVHIQLVISVKRSIRLPPLNALQIRWGNSVSSYSIGPARAPNFFRHGSLSQPSFACWGNYSLLEISEILGTNKKHRFDLII